MPKPTSKNGGYTYDERAILGDRTERVVKRTLRIRVEAHDNAHGDPASAASCVVTLACKRARGKGREPVVATITGYKVMKVVYGDSDTGHFERYIVPGNLRKQLHEFDDAEHPRDAINPQEYAFRPIAPSLVDRRKYAASAKTGTGAHQARALEVAAAGPIVDERHRVDHNGRAASQVLGHDCRKRPIFRALA